MWIPKWQRDQLCGVDSPVPTQAVSNEEFLPRPQSQQQRQWEQLIGEIAAEKSKKLGMERRDFMRTSMGMATAFLASNMVFGPNWDVSAAETLDPAATEEKFPKGEYFIVDVQTHFTDGVAIGFRKAEFVKNMGFDLGRRIERLLQRRKIVPFAQHLQIARRRRRRIVLRLPRFRLHRRIPAKFVACRKDKRYEG